MRQIFKFTARELNDLVMVLQTLDSKTSEIISLGINISKSTLDISDDDLKYLVESISKMSGEQSRIDGRYLYDNILDIFTHQDNHNIIEPITPLGVLDPII